MITFKQLEALYWIAEMGSFETAANKLHMSQSAISKRIQELEESFDVELFDRSKRQARLTEKGFELLDDAKSLLESRDALVERISSNEVLVKHFRIGVTELTAMTWLPALVGGIRQTYPKVHIEPSVELSTQLFRKLQDDQLDLIIVPDVYEDVRFVATPLKTVENAWMCAPHLAPHTSAMRLQDLGAYTVLTQGSSSGTGVVYERWLSSHNVYLPRTLSSDNLLVQVGLTLSGIGISYLPKQCLSHLVDLGMLKTISTTPGLPHIRYAALYRSDRQKGLNRHVAELASAVCDFSTLLLNRAS
ncbi:DNA-binding transcriptional regulator, LysR family [Pseudomonas cuatrocienegasensis]|uniref:DNA-binding transcriptional regulator, LysR family n=1 Tax=Pseudomonas cuatrocienegasensis TaxID=543360 RepID=A0ABY1BD48_9PSED|nr:MULTISPECIES: LysR family transcriptional regulator [Pseudomonas]OEC33960.1 LysR family transcriptional regulator [Pseudomonas sp. 21C1]SEQ57890.1 DNA-binding transcriptional regulator, LysR family [Pseudomonas cuatrocienegasensis]